MNQFEPQRDDKHYYDEDFESFDLNEAYENDGSVDAVAKGVVVVAVGLLIGIHFLTGEAARWAWSALFVSAVYLALVAVGEALTPGRWLRPLPRLDCLPWNRGEDRQE